MWGRMVDVGGLLRPSFGLAPNAYMLAAVLLAGMLATWAWTTYAQRFLDIRRGPALALSTGYYAVAFTMVIVMLQVKVQFIYFQF